MGVYDQAIAAAQRALALATASGEVRLQVLANLHLGIVYQTLGDYRQAIDCLAQTMAALEGAQQHERFGSLLPAVLSRADLARAMLSSATFAEGAPSGKKGCGLPRRLIIPGVSGIAFWGSGLLYSAKVTCPGQSPYLNGL